MKRQMILTLYLILEIIFFMFRINQEYYTIQLYPILIVIIKKIKNVSKFFIEMA